jgi:hypothetical protein
MACAWAWGGLPGEAGMKRGSAARRKPGAAGESGSNLAMLLALGQRGQGVALRLPHCTHSPQPYAPASAQHRTWLPAGPEAVPGCQRRHLHSNVSGPCFEPNAQGRAKGGLRIGRLGVCQTMCAGKGGWQPCPSHCGSKSSLRRPHTLALMAQQHLWSAHCPGAARCGGGAAGRRRNSTAAASKKWSAWPQGDARSRLLSISTNATGSAPPPPPPKGSTWPLPPPPPPGPAPGAWQGEPRGAPPNKEGPAWAAAGCGRVVISRAGGAEQREGRGVVGQRRDGSVGGLQEGGCSSREVADRGARAAGARRGQGLDPARPHSSRSLRAAQRKPAAARWLAPAAPTKPAPTQLRADGPKPEGLQPRAQLAAYVHQRVGQQREAAGRAERAVLRGV